MRKITVITGASSGMGAEFARQIYNGTESTEIWLIARSREKLGSLKAEIEKNTDTSPDSGVIPQVKVIPMDLSGKNGVNLFASLLDEEKVRGEFMIDMLVNNAGFGTYGEFALTPLDRELDMIDLNCTSLTGLAGLVIPYMDRGSVIINTASLAAFLPLGNFAVYAATKAYALSFSVALAAELKPKGIKVCALCPGSVSTDFANVASNGARREVLHGKDPVKVVRHCLKKAANGKKIILWSKKWKFTAFMSRFIGRYFCAACTFRYNKRPGDWK